MLYILSAVTGFCALLVLCELIAQLWDRRTARRAPRRPRWPDR